ncbi:hypothetical protein ACJJTC_011651 [Scirpophaga incertulas]
MPWLHQLLRQDQLELHVLPVQCLCEFLAAGAPQPTPVPALASASASASAAAAAAAPDNKAGELCAHLRRLVAGSEEGARAVLSYYLARLASHHAATRASASRGLKLVLTQTEDTSEMDYNADVSPEEWLDLLWELPHWESVRAEAAALIRAACLVECVPRHVGAYVGSLARHARAPPAPPREHLTQLVLDLSHLVLERNTVINNVLPAFDAREPNPRAHRALLALHRVLQHHLAQLRADASEQLGEEELEDDEDAEAAPLVTLAWPSGQRLRVHTSVAHAHLKLLCYGPSICERILFYIIAFVPPLKAFTTI